MAGYAVLKEFEVGVDIKSTLPIEPFEVVEGDTGNVINVSVTMDGSPVTIEDMLVTAVFQSPRGTRIQDSADGSITISGNTASIALLPGAVSPGLVSCELQLRSSTLEEPAAREDYDVLVTTARFSFGCRSAMLNESALEALPETPLLDALLSSASEAEAARAAAEAARVTAEAARVTAESARAAAEAERALAEQGRAEAEEARELAFAAMMEAASGTGAGKTGYGAPTGSTEGTEGELYFDLTNKNVYVCTAESPSYAWKMLLMTDGSANSLTISRSSSYMFENLPYGTNFTLQELAARLATWYSAIQSKQDALTFDEAPEAASSAPVTSGGVYSALHAGDWKNISTGTLSQGASSINITGYTSGYGTGGFSFDELRLILVGSMEGSSSARVFVNGSTAGYIRFATFAHSDPENPQGCMCILHLKKPKEGFALAERLYGGDPDDLGYVTTYAIHGAALHISGLTAYTAVKVTAEGQGSFAAGTKVILQGRNCS